MLGYSIIKYGVQVFLDVLRCEMSLWGVQISIIEFGLFKIVMVNEECNLEVVQDLWDGLSLEIKVEYGEKSLEKCKKFYW